MGDNVYAINIQDNFAPAKNFSDLSSIINLFVKNLFLIAGIIFFVIFLIAGFKILRGGENAEELKKIQAIFVSSAAGMIIIFGSYFAVLVITNLLNISTPLK